MLDTLVTEPESRPVVSTCLRCGDNLSTAAAEAAQLTCGSCVQRLADEARGGLRTIRALLSGLFLFCAVAGGVAVLSSALQIDLLGRMEEGDFEMEEANANDLRESIVGGLQTLAYLATAVTWCVWFRRTNGYLRQIHTDMEFGPNAWGWFFMPIMNLVKPYQAVRELWRCATQTLGESPAVLRAWWAVWIISGATGQASFRLMMRDDQAIQGLITATYVSLVDATVSIPAAILALLVARRIDGAVDKHPQTMLG